MVEYFVIICEKKEHLTLENIVAVFPTTLNENNELLYTNTQLSFLQYKCFEEHPKNKEELDKSMNRENALKIFKKYMQENLIQFVVPKEEFYSGSMKYHLQIMNEQNTTSND